MTPLELDVWNVGGIDEASFTFDRPVSIVTGPNATNKTSVLQALAFGLGRDEVSIRSDADEATVTLTMGDRSVTRTARRSGRGMEIEGEAWIEDPEDRELYEYFGCLLEFNPLRSAVRQNEDVEPVLKAPVDVDSLERKQAEKMDEKRALQREVSDLEDLEAEISEQEATIEEKQDRVAELEAELADLEERQAATNDGDDDLDALREKRADLVVSENDLAGQISEIEDAMERLEDEREAVSETLEEKEAELAEYDVGELKSRRESLRDDIEAVKQRQDILQTVLSTNREMLRSEYTGVLGQESNLMGEQVTCWVCGDATPTDDIEENIEQLQTLIEADKEKKAEVKPQIREIEETLSAAKETRKSVQELETRQRNIDQQLDEYRDSLAIKRERRESIQADLEELDERIDAAESERTEEITDLTEEIESVRIDLQSVRQSIDTAEERIETLERKRREREEKKERIETLSAEIASLTDRIENLERHLREDFNEAMEDLVDELGYQRIQRIWLDGEFDLVVARNVDGSVREDSVRSLSESEREVIGLVLALAGYTAFDLEDVSPVLQLDTLGALDAGRVSKLLEYFSETPAFLVAAVLPENQSKLDYPAVKPVEQMEVASTADD